MVVDDLVKEKQKEKVENISGQEWIKIAQVTDRYSEYCCHYTIQACSQNSWFRKKNINRERLELVIIIIITESHVYRFLFFFFLWISIANTSM